MVERLTDKLEFVSFALENELPIPQTFLLRSREAAEAAASSAVYPCVLKPALRSVAWDADAGGKVLRINSAEEFLSTYDRVAGLAETLIAQEWVEGTDGDLFSCNCYFDRNSQSLASFIARKIRQWPPVVGISSSGEEVRNDEVLDVSLRLFTAARYQGLGYVEMKRDKRTGRHYIIEPNIGRPTGRSAIAEGGGVELLMTMYCDAVGLPLPENRRQVYSGVKWIYLRQDLRSAWFYWRRGEITLKEYLKSIRGPKVFAVFSWRDPRPFIADLTGSLFKKVRSSGRAA
jgi:predicted ATP-grasp superfamily ATP-dependent carboligase